MACKVEKFESTGKGRGLRATSSASPGDVLYVAQPFAYMVTNAGHGRMCEFCLSFTSHLFQCSQCKFAKYCGKQCQAEAWPDHKRECKCLKRDKFNFNTEPLRLMSKIVFKVLRNTPCPSEELCTVSELQSNLENLSSEVKTLLVHFAERLQLYLKEEIPADFNLVELFAKELTNRSEIGNETMKPVIMGLYPSLSLFKHSCEPNCTLAYMGRHQHLRAIKKIEAGEELTVSYVSPLNTTEERQLELSCTRWTKCDCRRCQTCEIDEKMLAGDKQLSEQTKELANKVQELQDKQKWMEILNLCKAQLQRNSCLVPDENIYQLAILNHAMKACMHLFLLEEALHYGKRTLKPYKMYTLGVSAIYAEQMYNLGKILIFQGRREEAAKTFLDAFKVLKLFKGTDHPMTQTVISFLQQPHTWQNIH